MVFNYYFSCILGLLRIWCIFVTSCIFGLLRMLVLITPTSALLLTSYHKTKKCVLQQLYFRVWSPAVFRIIPVVCVSSPRLCCAVLVLFVMFFEYPIIVERSGCAVKKYLT